MRFVSCFPSAFSQRGFGGSARCVVRCRRFLRPLLPGSAFPGRPPVGEVAVTASVRPCRGSDLHTFRELSGPVSTRASCRRQCCISAWPEGSGENASASLTEENPPLPLCSATSPQALYWPGDMLASGLGGLRGGKEFAHLEPAEKQPVCEPQRERGALKHVAGRRGALSVLSGCSCAGGRDQDEQAGCRARTEPVPGETSRGEGAQ